MRKLKIQSFPMDTKLCYQRRWHTVADFTVQLYSTTAENSTWTSREVALGAYAGQTVRIAFVNNSNDMYVLLVDNIKVENAPTAPPTALQLRHQQMEQRCCFPQAQLL